MKKLLVIFILSIVLFISFVKTDDDDDNADEQDKDLTENDILNDWQTFKSNYSLNFTDEDDSKHFEIFKDNYIKVIEHNKLYEENKTTYKVYLNKYSYLSQEESARARLGLKSFRRSNITFDDEEILNNPRAIIPNSVDWRGYVSSVKDQSYCGSCWAFAVAGVVESLYTIKYKTYKRFSEQQLIDCTYYNRNYMNYGCNGGWIDNAFEYVRQNGLVEEAYYPYRRTVYRCNPRYDLNKIRISRHVELPLGDENALKAAVALRGPVAVGIDASLWGFSHYRGGIFNDYRCSPYRINHAVIVVGYGTENGQDYWLIRNSWGTRWGIGGYGKIARNRRNMCGITSMANYAIL